MQVTDIGHGRGWLDAPAAASIARIDAQLGRPADINDAGRSAAQADENYRRWIAYRNGGPWAPYALPSWLSVHCKGLAADSDDWYNPASAAVWRDNGWRQTARYNDDRDEPWHGEYFINLDNHRYDPPPTGGGQLPPLPEGKTMSDVKQIHWTNSNGIGGRALIVPGTAWAVPFTETGATFANRFGDGFETGDSIELTKSLFDAVIAASARCAPTALTITTVDAGA